MDRLIINGLTGFETDHERNTICQKILADAQRMPGNTEEERRVAGRVFGEQLELHHLSYGAARFHNTLAPLTAGYRNAHRAANHRCREANEAYADLAKSTTTAWHAAHHRFTTATIAARDALAEMVRLAEELHDTAAKVRQHGLTRDYDKMVPADQRVVLPELDAARLDFAGFVETSTERFAITRATITGDYPTGFAPAEVPAQRAGDSQDDESRPEWLADWTR